MKARPTYALRPFSLAATALLRGSALRHIHRPTIYSLCSTSSSALGSSPMPSATGASCSVNSENPPKKWDIPWGNHEEGAQPETLTRTLETLPGAQPGVESDRFTVMSFNILAQSMASSRYFRYVPKGQLRKKVRWPRVRDEVSRYGADIICLQECDAYSEILNSLRQQGDAQGKRFEGVYKKRVGSRSEHGVAVLFDSQVFRLLDSGSCDYGRDLFQGVGAFALLQDRRCRDGGSHENALGRARTDGKVGRAEKSGAERGDRDGGRRGRDDAVDATTASIDRVVCVATTHLYWHPDGGDIRMAQAEVFMSSLEAFLRERFGERYASVPVVLAGDLNNVPGVDVYRLLSTGVCRGGTPQAFTRRRAERDAARQARKAEEDRRESAMVDIRKKNAAVIAAANAAKGAERDADARISTPAGVAREAGEHHGGSSSSSAAITASMATAGSVVGPAAVDAASASEVEAGSSLGRGTSEGVASVGSRDSTEEHRGGDGAAVCGGSIEGVEEHEGVHQAREGRSRDGSVVNRADGDRDTDVREYKQAFWGFSSAYGDYSSVFDSQLSDEDPADKKAWTCQTTGKRTVGHVQLGARGDGSVEGEPGQLWQGRAKGEPQLTTCTDKFAGTIDYIWHTPQLSVRSLLGLPSLQQAMQGGGLPTMTYPSDHVSIMAELQWRRQPDGPDAATPQ